MSKSATEPLGEPPLPRQGTADANTALLLAIHRTAAGDRAAFEQLYGLTSVKLLAICRRVLPDVRDAEEALQNAYLNIWRNADSFDPALGRPMTWLITVAHRCAIDVLRRRRRAGEVPPVDLAEHDTPRHPAEGGAALRLIMCLRGLDHPEERLLHAAFFEGATYAEIADRSSTPLGTVKSRVRRALLKLAECLR